ncbi:MAG: hypothetical protein FK733_01300 [Asgard group archaeon]|nr:hypothetical protein [Asgard group archaeon]
MNKRRNFLITLSFIAIMFLTTTISALNKNIVSVETDIIEDQFSDIEGQKPNDFDIPYTIEATSDGYSKISQLDVDFGNAYKIFQFSTVLFIAGKTGGVTFVNVNNPSNPSILGNYYTGGIVEDCYYQLGYAYLASSNGLEILDVSDYDNVESLNSTYDGGYAHDIAFIGFSTMYVADGTDGLEIYSFSESRTAFTKIANYDFGVSEILSIRTDPQNGLAFLMAGADGVVVVDITTPLSPNHITTLKDGTTDSRHGDITSRKLFVADGANGLKVYNYTSVGNITLIGQLALGPSEYAGFFKRDVSDKGFLSTGVNGYFHLVNISDPTNLTIRWSRDYSPGGPQDIGINFRTIYLANDFDLKIIDLTDENNPIVLSRVIFAGEPSATAISGAIGVLAVGLSGLNFINLTDITDPIIISKFLNEGTSYYDIVFDSDVLYCATSTGLDVLNITDLDNVVSIGSYVTSEARSIALDNDIIYLPTIDGDLYSIDVTDPTNPVLAHSVDLTNYLFDIVVNGTHAFVTKGTAGMTVVDITTPTSMSIVTTLATPSGSDGVDINGHILAIAELTNGVNVYNVSDLGSITSLDGKISGNTTKVAFDGTDLLYTTLDAGLFMCDASDPTNLPGTINFDDGGSMTNLAVNNSIVFTSDVVDSFEVIGIDTDYDRLSDYIENTYWGTNPTIADTDSDGLLDGDEVDYWEDRGVDPISDWDGDTFVNLLDIDSDNDTITDGDEVNIWNSDPIDFDSDDDGLLDEDEVNTYDTQPALADSDSDGVNDYLEVLGLNATILYGGNPGANESGWLDGQIDGGLNASNPDTDGDIPWDGWELTYGFNPLLADSSFDNDSDLLDATEEFLNGTDPWDPDSDDDGLTDGEEVLTYHTNPNNVDSDNDLIDDFYEISNGMDPNDPSDGEEDDDLDGLTNYEEYYYGTDPNDADTDDDLMLDEWEVYQGTDPFTDDRDSDYDNDGLTNYEEYLLHTDPNDPDTDEDGFLDSVEFEEGTDPLDPEDYPERTIPSQTAGFGFFVTLSIFSLVGLSYIIIKRRK